jgi:hypothetical protein
MIICIEVQEETHEGIKEMDILFGAVAEMIESA